MYTKCIVIQINHITFTITSLSLSLAFELSLQVVVTVLCVYTRILKFQWCDKISQIDIMLNSPRQWITNTLTGITYILIKHSLLVSVRPPFQ